MGSEMCIRDRDVERSQFNAELSESQTLGNYIRSVIQLYKALGGGWTPGETSDTAS